MAQQADTNGKWRALEVPPDWPMDYLIQSSITQHVVCPLSHRVMEAPATLLCGHVVDYNGIQQHLANSRSCTCPINGCDKKIKDMRQVKHNDHTKALIRELLRTRCVVEGCTEVMTVNALKDHVKYECPLARFRCLEVNLDGEECGYVTTRPNVASHAESCPNQILECRCGEQYCRGDQDTHRQVCPEEQVRCPICNDLMKRRLHDEVHTKDPEVMARHVQILLDENKRLARTKLGREQEIESLRKTASTSLIKALGAVTTLCPVNEGEELAMCIEGLVGSKAWQEMAAKGRLHDEGQQSGQQLDMATLLVGLADFLVNSETFEGGGIVTLRAILEAMHRLTHRENQERAAARQAFVRAEAAEVVWAGLTIFPTDRQVQLCGLELVGSLSFEQTVVKAALVGAGVIKSVISAMRAFADDCELQVAGLRALAKLAYRNEGVKALQEEGAVPSAVASMKAFPQHLDVQRLGCMVVANMAAGGGEEEVARTLVDGGAVEAVVAALGTLPGDAGVVMYGCRAISNLCEGSKEVKQRLIEAQANVAVQGGLTACRDNEPVQHCGKQAQAKLNAYFQSGQ